MLSALIYIVRPIVTFCFMMLAFLAVVALCLLVFALWCLSIKVVGIYLPWYAQAVYALVSFGIVMAMTIKAANFV